MSDSNNAYDAILGVNKIFMETFGQADPAGVAELYPEDGQFLPSNSDAVVGKSAIKEAFQGLLDGGIRGIQLDTLEVESFGDTAYEVGLYTLKDEASETLDHGKFIVIWKQIEGNWKLHRDIINSSVAS